MNPKRRKNSKKGDLNPKKLPSASELLANPEKYSPADLVASIDNPRLQQVLYELTSSLGLIPRLPTDTRPEWAVQAWRECIRSTGLLSAVTIQANPDQEQEAGEVGLALGTIS